MGSTVAFDIIGTCFSLERPRQALAAIGAPPGLFDTWFAQSQRDYFALSHAGGYAPLREVMRAQLPRTLAAAGVPHSPHDISNVVAAFSQLDPRPELAAALQHLRDRGWTTIALTNGGVEATQALLEGGGVAGLYDQVFSCDSIQISKPNAAVYGLVTERPGGEGAWMVAAHAWDLAGAARAGLRTAFIPSDEPGWLDVYPEPDLTATDLLDAARRIVAWAAG